VELTGALFSFKIKICLSPINPKEGKENALMALRLEKRQLGGEES